MKNSLFVLLIILLFIGLSCLGMLTGSVTIEPEEMWSMFTNYSNENNHHYILLNLRLPRIVLAFLVGGALSMSGYIMQAMVNNPLADPYMLGTASGASLGASLIYLILPAVTIGVFVPSIAAFAGAMMVTLLAVAISNYKGHLVPSKLLLSGIALSSLTVAMVSFMIFYSNDESKLKSVIFWSMGSFENARWTYIPLLGITILIATILFTFLNKNINLLLLGESRSQNLGLNLSGMRWTILIGASLVTGFSVATCGPIGFVGLMIPHFIRGIFGVTGRFNILFAVLGGGVFLMACDILARKLYPPAGMPIGIVTSFLGIPFFVYLLSKNSYRFS